MSHLREFLWLHFVFFLVAVTATSLNILDIFGEGPLGNVEKAILATGVFVSLTMINCTVSILKWLDRVLDALKKP